jgi:dTDP-4-dehydrorhamnose reductase
MVGYDAIVTGTGLLGSRLVPLLEAKGLKSLGVDKVSYPGTEFEVKLVDITDIDSISGVIEGEGPEVIFHTAALTNVDGNEKDPELAHKVNVVGTRNIALAAKKVGARVIAVSTDFVFDGEKGMYKETDEPNPISVYGKTKLEGEQELAKVGVEHAILRTSVLYGSYRTTFNFVTWIIDSLKEGKEVRIVTDQYNSPTLADDLARALYRVHETGKMDLFHAGGGERINRYELAKKIAEVMGLDGSLITPVTSEEFDFKAKRPPDSSLDVSKLADEVHHRMVDIYTGLEVVKAQEEMLGKG